MSSLVTDLTDFIGAEVSLGQEPVDADTDLVMSGLVDSLGVMRIVDWLESRMDIRIDPGDVVMEHFGSVAMMLDYLRNRGDCDVS